METPEVLLWSRVDVIGPDGNEVLGRLDAYSAVDTGRWAWWCAMCGMASRASFRAVDRALRGLAEHWDQEHGLDDQGSPG